MLMLFMFLTWGGVQSGVGGEASPSKSRHIPPPNVQYQNSELVCNQLL